jgi:hypothetical protein
MVGSALRCRICGTTDLDGVFSVSGIGQVCYTCFQKPHKQSHREECIKKFGKKTKIDFKDHKLEDFCDAD